MNVDKLFTQFLEDIKSQVSDTTYTLWFSALEPISFDGETLKIKIPLGVVRSAICQTYYDIVSNILQNITGKIINIECFTETELEELNNNLSTHDIEDNDLNEIVDKEWDSNLDPTSTFENYVVGDANRLAVVAAHAVAENPGMLHNPLFIYGKSGTGKTHLMKAIGNYIVKTTNKKVLYCSSNTFINDYIGINLIEKGSDRIKYANAFKEKYQNVDVLIMDDIQFLVAADKSQQEFFVTFEALYNKNKQIIISSDKSPDDLKKLEERLKSRFMWGLPVDIFPPEFNLRRKIINSKIKNTFLEDKLSEEIIDYIANECTDDIRFIIGTLNKLIAYTAMMCPQKIDLDFTKEALGEYIDKGNIYGNNSIANIQKTVADYFNISVSDMKSKKKTNNIAKPRHIAIYLSRLLTDEGLSRIGLEFGGRDHSTISASYDKITNDLKTDDELVEIVKNIKNKL